MAWGDEFCNQYVSIRYHGKLARLSEASSRVTSGDVKEERQTQECAIFFYTLWLPCGCFIFFCHHAAKGGGGVFRVRGFGSAWPCLIQQPPFSNSVLCLLLFSSVYVVAIETKFNYLQQTFSFNRRSFAEGPPTRLEANASVEGP